MPSPPRTLLTPCILRTPVPPLATTLTVRFLLTTTTRTRPLLFLLLLVLSFLHHSLSLCLLSPPLSRLLRLHPLLTVWLLGLWVFGFSCREPRSTNQTGRGFWGFYFFNLDLRWLLGVDLVGFMLNCWINARICGLIVAGLCLYLMVANLCLCFILQTLVKIFLVKYKSSLRDSIFRWSPRGKNTTSNVIKPWKLSL